MEIGKKTYYMVFRVSMAVLFCCAELIFWLLLIASVTESLMNARMWILAAFGQVVLMAFFWQAMLYFPWITLTEDTIGVMVLFKSRQYPWKSVCQIGILRLRREWQEYPDFVILLPGGSPRKHNDRTFKIRNFGKLIHIPNTPAIRQYIVAHYGPLDFNLWDNPKEQSIVMD